MSNFLINIHAHTIFSDGRNTPYYMALKAKELGFCCLVITDHWYRTDYMSLTMDRFELLNSSVREAEEILPVIVGIELPVEGEEVLVFGEEAVRSIISEGNETFSIHAVRILKKSHPECAIILCHPRNPSPDLIEILDGYEMYNSGQDWIINRDEEFKDKLSHLPSWSNSDAHTYDMLSWGYNVVDSKIQTERDLVEYIKSGKQPVMYLRGEEVSL